MAIGYDIQNNIEYHFYCIRTDATFLKLDEKQVADCLRGGQVSVKNIMFYFYKNRRPEIPNRLRIRIANYNGQDIEFISNKKFADGYGFDPRRIGEVVNGRRKELNGLTVKFKDNSEPSIVYIDVDDEGATTS